MTADPCRGSDEDDGLTPLKLLCAMLGCVCFYLVALLIGIQIARLIETWL